MNTIRKAISVLTITTFALTLGACSSKRSDSNNSQGSNSSSMIGVSMPTKGLERWNRDGAHLEELLKKDGYKVSLQYADNKIDQQISQIQNMINQNSKVLVIAAIDGSTLGPVLKQAKSKGIKVFAYDRLIRDTADVDYYATFDNYLVGKLQGQFIEEKLKLKEGSGPFTFEPFAGEPGDNNASFFFGGAWDVLKPYIDSGKLITPSGKAPKTKEQWQSIGTKNWQSSEAQNEMDNRLHSFYKGKAPNAILSPNDSLALGISQALESAGIKPGANYPILTGQDADETNIKNILAGKQSMTVFKDTRKLGDQTAKMIKQMLKDEKVEVNDEKTYNNGKKVVPSFLIKPVVVTKENVKTELVDTGFYTKSQLGL